MESNQDPIKRASTPVASHNVLVVSFIHTNKKLPLCQKALREKTELTDPKH